MASAPLSLCFSLPLRLSPKRVVPFEPTLVSAPMKLRSLHALLGAENKHLISVRSLPIGGSPETVGILRSVPVCVPRSVPVRVAHELLLAGHHYLDIRTVDEFNAGHVEGATNVPYMLKTGAGLTRNPNFVKEVISLFGKDDEIIIGCKNGKRSLMAAADLLAAGFSGITDIAGGYSAWEQTGLPMKQ